MKLYPPLSLPVQHKGTMRYVDTQTITGLELLARPEGVAVVSKWIRQRLPHINDSKVNYRVNKFRLHTSANQRMLAKDIIEMVVDKTKKCNQRPSSKLITKPPSNIPKKYAVRIPIGYEKDDDEMSIVSEEDEAVFTDDEDVIVLNPKKRRVFIL